MSGNLLVGQSGGPTSVINSSLAAIVQASRRSHVIDRVFGMRWGIEGFIKGEVIDLGRQRPEVIERLRLTPSSALGSCRYKLTDSDLPRILEKLAELEVHYLLLIGGNDTMDTIARIERFCRDEGYEIAGVGIPKTVDNDLFGTDHTPGYPSAARYVALSVQQSGRLARDMMKVDRFVIHQTVGRDAGWLAAAAALARRCDGDPPHLIYLPERPIDKERFVSDAVGCISRYGFVSIVCGEGIVWSDGTPVSASADRDRFSNVEFGAMAGTSAALVLHGILAGSGDTKLRGEFQVTESLPMCAMDRASKVDLEEAFGAGLRGVVLAEGGASGVMVTIQRSSTRPYSASYGSIPLEEVATRTKPMPDEFIAPQGNDITPAFIEYARPLVGDLPEYASLEEIPVGDLQ